jgi:fatty acid desaturase
LPRHPADDPLTDAIRAIPAAWFRPAPAVYWTDTIGSAALGWTALAFAARSTGWARVVWLTIATFALYRAALFIHEITHRAKRDLPGYTFVWNLVVGIPLMLPSFLYEGVHTDHHRQRCYGTEGDPEYVPYGRRSPILLVTSVLLSLLAPLAFAVRFAAVAPLSWLAPSWRAAVARHASALVINRHYVRHAAIGSNGRAQEAAACTLCWIAAWLWWSGRLPAALPLCWLAVGAAISGVNAVRTLAAHRYDHDGQELTMSEQLLDSCTIAPTRAIDRSAALIGGALHALVAPVGLRYHALHHWLPRLPYHNLGPTHRLLVATLQREAPYHATIERGFVPPLRDLVARSRRRNR